MKKDSISFLYEDDHVLAINKPPLWHSVPDPTTPLYQTVLGRVQEKCKTMDFTPYLLHRLDAPTSGVLLFGKHERDRQALENIFKQPDTAKKYLALLKGAPLGKKITFKLPARESNALIDAETDFTILQRLNFLGDTLGLVEATIKTGRRHQIRQHFQKIGCPVVMDRLYGDEKFNRKFSKVLQFSRLFLHARSIEFTHPLLHKTVRIEAPLAPDLFSVLKKIIGRDELKKLHLL